MMDEDRIRDIDEANMLKDITSMPDHIREAAEISKKVRLEGPFKSIFSVGMGGSGIAGELLGDLVDRVPVFLCRDYELPKFINKDSLIILNSYSGNTEETLACAKAALKTKANVLVITSGGRLLEMAKKHTWAFVNIPSGLRPRASLGYQLFSILCVLSNSGVVNLSTDIGKAVEALEKGSFKDKAIALAEKMKGRIPLIYSSPQYSSVAVRWKAQLNENAKIHAFANIIPEMNHNEIMGFTKLLAEHYVVFIRDEQDNKRIIERVRITKKIITNCGVDSTELVLKGSSKLSKMITAVHVGDLVSYYLALEYGVDPSVNHLIDEIKRELTK
ncbi:bifunctional phosphoglucose/phosphomannose isomerase [Candidatus Woesearchaeota archaeon CG1_02_47_18]|nr:MAG: bifunctional phosphoglucose/phosphomannose isomerase [Candidatus Woesearchaeota archaeon CG1_02_47_18]